MSIWVLVSISSLVVETLANLISRHPYIGAFFLAKGCQGLDPVRERNIGNGKSFCVFSK
jgi:hypothetical protein